MSEASSKPFLSRLGVYLSWLRANSITYFNLIRLKVVYDDGLRPNNIYMLNLLSCSPLYYGVVISGCMTPWLPSRSLIIDTRESLVPLTCNIHQGFPCGGGLHIEILHLLMNFTFCNNFLWFVSPR